MELSIGECQELIEKYAQASRRIMEAGLDAVEVHGCHGYLLAQFLSPFTNRCQDQYGGSLEGRMRLSLEVVKRVKELCGPEFPVFYRVSGSEMFQGGFTLEDTSIFAAQLEKARVDCLDVSGSSLEGPPKLAKVISCNYYPHKYHVASAAALKKVVNIPVIGVGRINSPELAAEVMIEATPRIGSDLGITVRPVLMNRLIRSTLNVFNKAQMAWVEEKEVTIDRDGDIITLGEVDNIVLSVGTEAENSLQAELEGNGFELIAVGDCQETAGIMEAVDAGFEAGRSL